MKWIWIISFICCGVKIDLAQINGNPIAPKMTWSSFDKNSHREKHDKANRESCFSWPFVLYRFHRDHWCWLLCEIIIRGYSDGLSTFLVYTLLLLFLLIPHNSRLAHFLSPFSVYQTNVVRNVKITTKRKWSVESKRTFWRTPTTFSLITSISSFLFPASVWETNTSANENEEIAE